MYVHTLLLLMIMIMIMIMIKSGLKDEHKIALIVNANDENEIGKC